MGSIVITGGCGFIGYHLAKKLSYNENINIYLIDNFFRGKKDKSIKKLLNKKNIFLIKHDLTKPFKKKIKNVQFIYHLAAIVGVSKVISNSYNVLVDNIKILENILNFASLQKKLKKFIFLSTSEVYGSSLDSGILKFPTKETSIISTFNPPNKRSSYMLSKIYGEAMCKNSKINSIIIRPHNIYGPRMGFSHVVPELIKKMESNRKEVEIFNPTHKRCFCFIDDAVNYLDLVIRVKIKEDFLILNLGNNNEEISISDLSKKLNLHYRKKLNFKKLDIGSPKRRLPCLKKIINLTKYKPKINLDDGIKKTINWYRFEKKY